jgi:hypothetical protein
MDRLGNGHARVATFRIAIFRIDGQFLLLGAAILLQAEPGARPPLFPPLP